MFRRIIARLFSHLSGFWERKGKGPPEVAARGDQAVDRESDEGYSAREEEEIRNRLKGLGYLE